MTLLRMILTLSDDSLIARQKNYNTLHWITQHWDVLISPYHYAQCTQKGFIPQVIVLYSVLTLLETFLPCCFLNWKHWSSRERAVRTGLWPVLTVRLCSFTESFQSLEWITWFIGTGSPTFDTHTAIWNKQVLVMSLHWTLFFLDNTLSGCSLLGRWRHFWYRIGS